jgi:MFS family permease
LTEYASWQWNFFVNIPVGIAVLIAAFKVIPAHAKEESDKNLDLPGAVLVTGGLMTLVYTLVKAPEWGWTDGQTLGLLALSAALLAGFIFNESRAKHPLMPLSIFKIRNLSAANLVQLPITASLFAMFFFLSLYIQMVLQYSPVMTGLSFLPVTVIIGVTATLASKLVGKVGFKPLLVAAPILMAIGLLLLAQVPVAGEYWIHVFPGLAFIALGAGMTFVAISIAATSGVPGDEAGLASGLLNTAQQIGGALGLAILSGVAAAKTQEVLAATAPTQAAIAQATVDGFHSAFYTGVGFALLASVLALVLIKAQKPQAGVKAGPAMH